MNVTGSAGIGAEAAEAHSSGPIRQSSAVGFNAALGGWDASISAKPTHKVVAAMPCVSLAQPHALHSVKAVNTPALPQLTGCAAQATFGSEQQTQDLRPRSSDGILQRITVDRGPAKGQTLPIHAPVDCIGLGTVLFEST